MSPVQVKQFLQFVYQLSKLEDIDYCQCARR